LSDERRAYQDRDCGAAEIQRFAENAPRWPDGGKPSRRSTDDLSGDFPTPSPPAKKAAARQESRQPRASNWTWNGGRISPRRRQNRGTDIALRRVGMDAAVLAKVNTSVMLKGWPGARPLNVGKVVSSASVMVVEPTRAGTCHQQRAQIRWPLSR
jgi:hypothetical protein